MPKTELLQLQFQGLTQGYKIRQSNFTLVTPLQNKAIKRLLFLHGMQLEMQIHAPPTVTPTKNLL